MTEAKLVKVIIPFQPKPQERARPRSVKAKASSPKKIITWLRDPSAEKKKAFQALVTERLFGSDPVEIIFPHQPVTLDITFKYQSPKSHFIGGKVRDSTRIKPSMKHKWPLRGDIDNLDKFVLDGLQGIMYTNDKQVQKQSIRKIYHREGDCNGEIEIIAKTSQPGDLV